MMEIHLVGVGIYLSRWYLLRKFSRLYTQSEEGVVFSDSLHPLPGIWSFPKPLTGNEHEHTAVTGQIVLSRLIDVDS